MGNSDEQASNPAEKQGTSVAQLEFKCTYFRFLHYSLQYKGKTFRPLIAFNDARKWLSAHIFLNNFTIKIDGGTSNLLLFMRDVATVAMPHSTQGPFNLGT